MVMVTAPFFSTFASGSIKKTLTVRPLFNGNSFCMALYKQRAGKRHQIQIDNALIFKNRVSGIFKEK